MNLTRGHSSSLTKPFHRIALLALVAGSLIALALVNAVPSLAGKTTPQLPPGDVYTCEWIAAHPLEAAEARVTCDPANSMGQLPVLLGPPSFDPQDVGCNWIPNSGYVGQGVFAWTSFKYSSVWDWYPNPFGTQDYTWYIQTQSGTLDYDREDTNDHLLWYNGATNIFRWGAQNHVDAGRRWRVCWDTQ